jgi:hypothetical protein
MLSALEDASVASSTSSVTSFSIEVGSVVVISSLGSNTGSVSHVSADNLGTVVIIPEVM